MKKMIIKNSDFLAFQSEIAVEYGLNEAIILQKIHYWTKLNAKDNRNLRNGYYWVYVTLDDLSGQLPFFSKSTIQRTLKNLKDEGVLIVSNYNQRKYDKTVWYRIDYEKLEKTLKAYGQIDHIDIVKMNTPIPKNNKEEIMNNENGFSEQKSTLFSSGFLNNLNVTVKAVMDLYESVYLQFTNQEHPILKENQRQRIHDTLYEFLDSYLSHDIDDDVVNEDAMDAMNEIIFEFFEQFKPSQTDYNMNHFASPKILENRAWGLL